MGVEHQVGGPVVVGDASLAQTAVLVDTLHVAARGDVGVAVVVVAVDTHAVGNVQPARKVEACGHGARDTLVLVGQFVLVDDPVRVLDFFRRIHVGEHAVLGTVVVHPVRHVLAARPGIQSRHRTVTAAVIQAGGGEGLLGVGDGVGHVGAHRQFAVLLLTVETHGVLDIGGAGDDTILVEVRGGEEERAVLVAARHADAVVEHIGSLEEVGDVVIGPAGLFAPGAEHLVGLQHAVGVVGTAGIRILDFRSAADGSIRILGREVDLHVAVGCAFLGGDDHDTVGSTRTIEGRGGGALQHGHALDVFRVDVHHTVGERGGRLGHTVGARVTGIDGRVVVDDTVDDEERLVVTAFGSRVTTTDDDRRTSARGTAGLRHVDARHLAREGVDDVGLLVAKELVGLDFGNRIAQGFTLLLDTEGRHDRLLQHFRIIGKDDVDEGSSFDRHGLGLVADTGECEVPVPGSGDPVRTVGVGRRTDGRSFNHHISTNDRLIVVVHHRTGDGHVLSPQRSCGKDHCAHSRQKATKFLGSEHK